MSGGGERSAAAAAADIEDAPAITTIANVMQTLAMQPTDVLMKAKKEIDILGNIRALKEEQKTLRDQRKVVSKQLRNEEKRRMREASKEGSAALRRGLGCRAQNEV